MATAPVDLEALPVALPVPEYLDVAAQLLEQALKAGPVDANVAYMLAVCYKRQGKTGEARGALRKIAAPEANVWLQLGLLSFADKQFADAEQEFGKALELDPSSYEASYNLLQARLSLGQVEACAALIPPMLPLAPSPEEQRFLSLLEALLKTCLVPKRPGPPPLPGTTTNGDGHPPFAPGAVTAADAQRLLRMLSGLGQFDAVYPLLRALAAALPLSQPVQEAYLEVVLVQAKQLAERCQWTEAEQLLTPLRASLGAAPTPGKANHVALLNLLGCCAGMLQDFERALECFSAALLGANNDAWLHQNLALTHELQGRLDLADRHWNRYFDLLDRRTPVPPLLNYVETLAFESLNRLADLYSKKERWPTALGYLQRAHRMRPDDVDALERLFHLYTQVKRPEDARRTLRRLRELKPNDPQFDLYELDIRETRTLEDIDRMLTDIRRILGKHPNDMRVEERAINMVANVIPLMGRMCDQLTEQLNKIVDQVRRLPNYQINWPAVHDVMRDLLQEFQKLRRITNKCMLLVTSEEHKRIIRDLGQHIDRKIELCQSMGG
jgi:tetratricopeptide (TPR) repeat protein